MIGVVEMNYLSWEECRILLIELCEIEIIGERFDTSSKGYMAKYNSKDYYLLRTSVENLTKDFPVEISNRERIFHILYNFKSFLNIRCHNCNKPVIFRSYFYGYSDSCCAKCSKLSKEKYLKGIETKLDRYGIASFTNVEKTKQTKLERYGDENYNNLEKHKKTNLEKYGDENYTNVELNKQTKLERYGDENYNNRDKANETFSEKYGDINYRNTEKRLETVDRVYGGYYHMQKTLRDNNMEKYGVEYPFQSIEFRDKADDTRLQLYGSKDYRNFDKQQQTMVDRYGVDWRQNLFIMYSKISQELFYSIYNELPQDLQIHIHFGELNKEYRVSKNIQNTSSYFYDFVITNIKLCIEFDGDYWHSTIEAIESDRIKQEFIENIGFKVIRIRECDYRSDKPKIINYCLNNILKML